MIENREVDGEWTTTFSGRIHFLGQIVSNPFGLLTVSASSLKVSFGRRRSARVVTVSREEVDRIEITRWITGSVVIVPRASPRRVARLRFTGNTWRIETALGWYGWPVMARRWPFERFTQG